MTIVYRQASGSDHQAIYLLLEEMHVENGIGALVKERVDQRIKDVLTKGICYIAVDGREIVGSVAVLMMEWWYSHASYLGDTWFYVKPSQRNSHIAKDLVMRVKNEAQRFKVPLCMGVLTPVRPEIKDKFMLRQGFRPLGGHFIWSPDGQRWET